MRPTAVMAGLALLTAGLALSAEAQKAGSKAANGQQPLTLEAAIGQSWPAAPPEWRARLVQDEAQRLCTLYRGKPPRRVGEVIRQRAAATIRYPDDGRLAGDWRRGEAIAQSGYGLRFTDTDASRPNGGNCYGCHQISRAEVSHGTLGPSLLGYGRLLDFSPAAVRKAYDKIYNSHTINPCSAMPRFGASGTLSIDQIRDLVALLMDPASPVNK